MNKNILFYGDPHGAFQPLIDVVEKWKPKAVVLLGDMDLDAPLEEVLASITTKTEVFFIHGNHDCDRQVWHDHLLCSELANRNLNGRVITIDGVRIAGLGGVFREKIWNPTQGEPKWQSRKHYLSCQPSSIRRSGMPLRHRASVWWEDYATLWDKRADILVTHEAPSSHSYGFEALDDLAHSMGVRRYFHGHHHVNYQQTLANCLKVHGVARAGVVDQSGNQLFTGLNRQGRFL